MATDTSSDWIAAGYEMLALSGPAGLKIEPLAKKVGKSKSSFYHFFADLDVFTGLLLKHHLTQSAIMAEKENTAQRIDPDLVAVLVEHRIDLLFNRQLRIYQNVPQFAETLRRSNELVGDAFITLWARDLGLQLTRAQLEGLFTLALENFFLQINADNLNTRWLSAYFANLRSITARFA